MIANVDSMLSVSFVSILKLFVFILSSDALIPQKLNYCMSFIFSNCTRNRAI